MIFVQNKKEKQDLAQSIGIDYEKEYNKFN